MASFRPEAGRKALTTNDRRAIREVSPGVPPDFFIGGVVDSGRAGANVPRPLHTRPS